MSFTTYETVASGSMSSRLEILSECIEGVQILKGNATFNWKACATCHINRLPSHSVHTVHLSHT